ncbi:MAG: zinc ABC transporter substrate-binding protein [Cycloclasticus sp.]|nr:zinc ABC transporter substrate-binding protein [Cycloclasticus sp.]MBQ0789233.1 zinc ABC transporter substrate-binding protein [Cycloclasticus sp.]
MLTKKISAFLYCLSLLSLPLVHAKAEDPLNVFACEPEWAALATQLGGDRLSIYSATSAKQDPHHIQARPSLIAKARQAELLICTGAELEIGWLPILLRKAGNGNIMPGQPGHFSAADHVQLLEQATRLDRSMGDVHAAGNPHFHLDPYRIKQIALGLSKTLREIDPVYQTHYQHQLTLFIQRFDSSIAKWEALAKPLQGKKIVVHHDTWVYLEQWLNFDKVATLEAKSGIPPSSTHLSQVLEKMRATQADFIIHTDYQNDRAARWLSEKTNIPVISLSSSVANGEDIFQWFDGLINALLETTP